MTNKYCPECGRKLSGREIGDEGIVPFCADCKRPWFSFSYPCVLCLVINQDEEIMLIEQSYGEKRTVSVAGYVQQGETAEEAAEREVAEETGLKVSNAQYIKSYYHERGDNLMLGFVCRVKKEAFHLSAEVKTAGWFSIKEAQALLAQSSVAKLLLCDYLKEAQKTDR